MCLAPTGAPGGLVRWTPQGAELLEATAAGLVPQAAFALGTLETCPAAAVDGAVRVRRGATSKGLRVALREPGGGWAAPVTLSSTLAAGVSAAVSARGDVVVAWIEYDEGFGEAHVEVARRAPGAAFGTPQRLAADSTIASAEVAVTATGEALLVVADDRALRMAIAPAGSVFAAPARLLRRDVFAGEPALAMTPDGRALLAAPGENGTTLFDREPGGAFVRRPAISFGDSNVALAMLDDGTAIVAWESAGTVTALRREEPGHSARASTSRASSRAAPPTSSRSGSRAVTDRRSSSRACGSRSAPTVADCSPGRASRPGCRPLRWPTVHERS